MKKYIIFILFFILSISFIYSIPDSMTLNLTIQNNPDQSDDGAYLYNYSTKKEVDLSLDINGLPTQVQEYDNDGNPQVDDDYSYCVIMRVEKGIYKRINKLEGKDSFYYNDGVHDLSPTILYYNENGWSIESLPYTSDGSYSAGGSIPHYFFFNEDNGNLDFGRYRIYLEVRKYTLTESGEINVSPLSENDSVFDYNDDGFCSMSERVSNIEYLDYGWIEYPLTLGNVMSQDNWAINADAYDANPDSTIHYTTFSENADTATLDFKWKKPKGEGNDSSDIEYTIMYSYDEEEEYEVLLKPDGTPVSMTDFSYDNINNTWRYSTTLANVFKDYYGFMYFKVVAYDPNWPDENDMDEDGDGTNEEWDAYYETVNKISIDYHKIGYSLLSPEFRNEPYYQSELIQFRWGEPAFQSTYTLQYKLIADSQGNPVSGEEWNNHQSFNSNVYSLDTTPDDIFSEFGTYEIRMMAERTDTGEIYYSDNILEIEYQSINSVIGNFVLQDSYNSGGEQRYTDFIMQNNYGGANPCPLYINWFENETVTNYYHTITKASAQAPQDTDFTEITSSIQDGTETNEKYYDFNISTETLIDSPGKYKYYFKFTTISGFDHTIVKEFNVRQFRWKIIPSFDENYFQVFAIGKGLTDPEKSIKLLLLEDSFGNSWKLIPNGTGIFTTPDDFNSKIYNSDVTFTLLSTMKKTLNEYYLEIGSSITYTIANISEKDYSITRGLTINSSYTTLNLGYMEIKDPEIYDIEEINGKIYYINSSSYEKLNVKIEDNYKFYIWKNTFWKEVGKITETGYYALVKSNVPKIDKSVNMMNYPNPFNPTTTIRFQLKNAGTISLIIYNSKGKVIKKLIENQYYDDGNVHEITWDGKDKNSCEVSSGVYYYLLVKNGEKHIKKMVLLK